MMFSIHLRALAITGLLVVQVNIAAAQPSGAIRGVIIDELGRPIGEATVVVSSLSEANTEETQTTSDGQYAYSGITPGLYTITAAKDVLGSEVFRIRVRDSHTVSVNFELAPGQRVAAYLFEAGEREALSRAFTTGIEATRSDEYEVAVDAFNAALDLSPTCLECHYNLAIAYTNIGRFDDAEVEFQSVLRLREDYAAAYYGLSSIYTRQGREAEAAKARSEANRLALERMAAGRAQAQEAVRRGVTFFNAGNVDDAIGRFEMAIESDATLPEAHYWLGLSLQRLGGDAPARSALQRYLQLAPSGEFAADVRQRLEKLEP